ncbi:MAG: hypothetical protein ABI652_08765, partial [Acidobacteriota bacterium]
MYLRRETPRRPGLHWGLHSSAIRAGARADGSPADVAPAKRTDQQILFGGLKEGIGISLDLKGRRLYATDLGGTVYSAKLDGSDEPSILTGQGALT